MFTLISTSALNDEFSNVLKAYPMELLPISNTTLLNSAINQSIRADIYDIVISTSKSKAYFLEHFLSKHQYSKYLNLSVNDKADTVFDDLYFHRTKLMSTEKFALILPTIYNNNPLCLKELVELSNTLKSATIGLYRVDYNTVPKHLIATVNVCENLNTNIYTVNQVSTYKNQDTAPSSLAFNGIAVLDAYEFTKTILATQSVNQSSIQHLLTRYKRNKNIVHGLKYKGKTYKIDTINDYILAQANLSFIGG